LTNKLNNRYDSIKMGFLCFVIAFIAVLPVLIKFSGNLFLVGDYMTQVLPFYKEGRRLFLSGLPTWSWNSFFGANFTGTYSYYIFGNPLFFILLLFPEKYLGIGISVLFLIKHFFAGLSAYLMFTKFFKSRYYAILGTLLYVFSSFTFDSTYYFIFLDAIALFPLLIYGIELIFEKKSGVIFTVAVFLNAIVNYYCFIGSSVFLIIYFIFRVKNNNLCIKETTVRCILHYIFGVLAAMYILLPSALTLLETSKALNSFSDNLIKGISSIPQIIVIMKGIIMPSEGLMGTGNGLVFFSFCSNKAFLPVFGAFFIFVSLYAKRQKWESKLFKFLFILTLVPFGNGLFNLFSNSSYTRWWYGLIFVIVLTSLKIIEESESNHDLYKPYYIKSNRLLTILILIITFVPLALKLISYYLVQDFILKYVPKGGIDYLRTNGVLEAFDFDDLRYLLVLIGLTIISYGSLYFIIKKKWLYYNKKATAILLSVVCAVSYCTYLTNDVNILSTDGISTPQVADEAYSESISYSFRTQFNTKYHNYSMLVNQPSINTFNSFKSKATYEFSRLAGFDADACTKQHFSTEAIQNVLSIKNIVDKDGNTSSAQYYCPFGYEYDYYIPDENVEFSNDKNENNKRIELMCSACYIKKDNVDKLSEYLKPLNVSTANWKEAVKKNRTTACKEFNMTENGFTAKTYGEKERLIYFSVPNDNGWKITVNGVEAEIYTVNGGMMGIIVPAGASEIEAKFIPPGMYEGLIISVVTIIILFFCYFIKKSHNSNQIM